MKRNKLLLILAVVVVLTIVLAGCNDCKHEEYGPWQITKAPTADAEGEAVRICKSCNVSETATVAKLSDTSVWTPTASTATHTSAGKITYSSADYGTVDVFVDRLNDHVYDKEVATEAYLVAAADCTHAATYRKSCVCGAVGTATFTSGAPAGHKAAAHPATQPVHTATALTNGNVAYWSCDTCGKLFSDADCTAETTLAAVTLVASHRFDAVVVNKEAGCTTEGSATQTCMQCGKEETIVLAAHGHDYSAGLFAPVRSTNDYWDIDSGETWSEEETDTDHHGPLCTVCGYVDKEHKAAHTYGPDVLAVKKDTNDYYIEQTRPCTACQHVIRFDGSQGEGDYKGYLSHSGWTQGETVAPTYAKDGYIPFTKGDITAKYAIDRIVAPYENTTYRSIQLSQKTDVLAGESSFETAWSNATLVVGDLGIGSGSAYPFRGKSEITVSDMQTGALDIKLTDGESVSHLLGYLDAATGIIVVQSNSDGYDKPTVISPFSVESKQFAASYCPDATFITYAIDCGVFEGHTTSILIADGKVHFNVSFQDASGNAIAAKDCCKAATVVVKDSKGGEIATFLKNSQGYSELADGHQGTYTGTQGNLVVDGLGSFTLGDAKGVYEVVEGDTYTADAYVVNEKGQRVQYYKATLTGSTYTLEVQSIHVTLHGGTYGTVATLNKVLYINCVPVIDDPVSNNDEYIFAGWYTAEDDSGVLVNEDYVVTSALTDLYAKWVGSVTLNVSDYMSGNAPISVPGNKTIFSKLPDYTGDNMVDVANNRYFDGWYLDSEFKTKLSDDAMPSVEDEGATIYAKWTDAGYWNGFKDDGTNFVYDEATHLWKVTKYNSTTYTRFEAINGDIIISFDFYFNNNGNYDEVTIKNGNTQIVSIRSNASGAPMIDSKQTITAIVKSGTELTFQNRLWINATDSGIFVENLKINGRSVTQKGVYDLKEGTYTCSGQSDLVLDGHGAFTWGSKSGTYTVDAVNHNDLLLSVMDGSSATEGYVVSLNGSTYTSEIRKVTVTFHYGEMYYANKDKLNEQAQTAGADLSAEVEIYKASALPTPPTIEGYEFLGWFKSYTGSDLLESVVPTGDMDVYARYIKVVKLTFKIGVDGYDDVEVNGHSGEELGSKLYKMPDNVTNGDKTFVGWTLEDGTTEVTATSKFTNDTVILARWEVAHKLFGYYKGYEFDRASLSTSLKYINVDIIGKTALNSSSQNGSITDFDEATGIFKITSGSSSRYAYYDAMSKTIVTTYSNSSTALTNDVFVMTLVGDSGTSTSVASKNYVYWDDNMTKLGMFTVDGVERYFLVYQNKVYGDVTVSVIAANGADVTDISQFAAKGNIMTITRGSDLNLVVGHNGTTFTTETDGSEGTYTGSLGTLVSTGYLTMTIGENRCEYVLDGNRMSFILNNSMKIIELGDGTYTQAQDGYAGEYTLPDGTSKITLDGLGGAGEGKTYVVNGTQITIYSESEAVNYGIDVDSKTLAGKSIFAGMTFTGSYTAGGYGATAKIIFDDAATLTGQLLINEEDDANYRASAYNISATIEGDVLTVTVVSIASVISYNNSLSSAVGQTFTMTYNSSASPITLTFTSTLKLGYVSSSLNNVVIKAQ